MFQKRNILFLIAPILSGQTRIKTMFYNILGQLKLHQKNITPNEGVINLSSLKSSIYILKADYFKTIKFIKN